MAKILVMDNELDILSSLRTILEKESYNVTCVATGQSAIQKVKVGRFDLAILDIMMPDLSGWEVFDQIIKLRPELKIMFLSVLEISPERNAQLAKYDNVQYLLKPFDMSIFIKKVKLMVDLDKNAHGNQSSKSAHGKVKNPKKGIGRL